MALTVGDVLAFSITITDENGALANAGTVTITVTHPDGTNYSGSPFTITATPTGIYEKTDLPATMAGRYVGKWVATGINASAHTQVFHVRSGDETALVSLDEVKDHLNIPLTTTTHDQELERKMAAATEVVEYFCGPIVRRTETREVTGGDWEIHLPHTHVVSLTSLTPVITDAPTITLADLATSTNGVVRDTGRQRISSGPLTAVYVVGRTVIADGLIEAALIITKHLWETQRGPIPSGILGGAETTFLPAFGFAIPNRAVDLMKLHPEPAGVA